MKNALSIILAVLMLALPVGAWGANEPQAFTQQTAEANFYLDGPVDGLPQEKEIGGDARQYDGSFDQNACIMLLDAKRGVVLFEQNPDLRAYPASTTKVLSTLMGIESGELDRLYTVGEEVNLVGNWSTMTPALSVGETISLRDMVYGAMLPSGCEASAAIGAALSGSTEAFADWMNRRAASLGMNSSHFVNANGITDSMHYSTAADMCRLCRAAMKNPVFREVAATYRYITSPTNMCGARTLLNTNCLINPSNGYYYPDCTGIKTGTTNAARFCLTVCADRNGEELILVILRAPTDAARYQYAKKLLDWGFENISSGDTELYFDSCENASFRVSVPNGTAYYYAPEANAEYALGSAAPGREFLIKYSAENSAGGLWYFTSEGYFIPAEATVPADGTVSWGFCADDCHPLPQGDIKGGAIEGLYGAVYADGYINSVEAVLINSAGEEAFACSAETYETYFDLAELGFCIPAGELAPGGYTLKIVCAAGGSEYVLERELEVISALAGDADGDGVLTFIDVTDLYLFLIGEGYVDPKLYDNADYNGDGKVDFIDIAELNLALIG